MSIELHPPIRVDKGTAVITIADGLQAVCFLGDDVGDLPAFDALDQLAVSGIEVARIAVRSAEAPDELLDRADLVVDGPSGAYDLLRRCFRACAGLEQQRRPDRRASRAGGAQPRRSVATRPARLARLPAWPAPLRARRRCRSRRRG